MAWHWYHVPKSRYFICDNRYALVEPERPANVPMNWRWLSFSESDDVRWAQWVEPDDETMERATGYCGLAGAPDA